MYSKIYEARTV